MGRRKGNCWIGEAINRLSIWYDKRQTNALIFRFPEAQHPVKLYMAIRYQTQNKGMGWKIEMHQSNKRLTIRRLDGDGADSIEEHTVSQGSIYNGVGYLHVT